MNPQAPKTQSFAADAGVLAEAGVNAENAVRPSSLLKPPDEAFSVLERGRIPGMENFPGRQDPKRISEFKASLSEADVLIGRIESLRKSGASREELEPLERQFKAVRGMREDTGGSAMSRLESLLSRGLQSDRPNHEAVREAVGQSKEGVKELDSGDIRQASEAASYSAAVSDSKGAHPFKAAVEGGRVDARKVVDNAVTAHNPDSIAEAVRHELDSIKAEESSKGVASRLDAVDKAIDSAVKSEGVLQESTRVAGKDSASDSSTARKAASESLDAVREEDVSVVAWDRVQQLREKLDKVNTVKDGERSFQIVDNRQAFEVADKISHSKGVTVPDILEDQGKSSELRGALVGDYVESPLRNPEKDAAIIKDLFNGDPEVESRAQEYLQSRNRSRMRDYDLIKSAITSGGQNKKKEDIMAMFERVFSEQDDSASDLRKAA